MDYIVGSVAALISGNVTPNRPKLLRKALTPTKHQSSPNVTPKSQLVDDRSIFLSPTQQKKKAIVKKSPKRIFQNPDLDTTKDEKGNSTVPSPITEKVKKHLKHELDADNESYKRKKSPNRNLNKSTEDNISPKKKYKLDNSDDTGNHTASKKKNKFNMESDVFNNENSVEPLNMEDNLSAVITNTAKSPKKAKQRHKLVIKTTDIGQDEETEEAIITTQSLTKKSKTRDSNQAEIALDAQPIENDRKKNKKRKNKNNKTNTTEISEDKEDNENQLEAGASSLTEIKNLNKKKKKNKKNKSEVALTIEKQSEEIKNMDEGNDQSESGSEEVKAKNIANPNAITDKDSESEHDSDDEIESENEKTNEKVLTNEGEQEQSSDEEEVKEDVKKSEPKNQEMSEEEIKRTIFVGNVPFSSKCKKEIKKIFNQYGQIDTIRIRTIPVKDARVTPKLAVIKNELHPERSTVNVYIKFADEDSVTKALKENNTVLNGNHLRVTRSATTGAEHDPRCAIFIGNLPFAIEDETLRNKFQNCGEIESVRVIRDKKTNAGKGFGYVNFASKDGVELALAMSEEDLTIKNRILRVNRCTQSGSKGQKKLGAQKFGGHKFGGQKFGDKTFGGQKFGGPQKKWGGGQDRNNQVRGNQYRNQGQRNQGRNLQTSYQAQREDTGAARRIMSKRQQVQESTDGPPNKKQNINKEKKPKKEYVGMTAEKKKKQKFNKDFKKKKALSEILSKK